jgi:hypothetical protein
MILKDGPVAASVYANFALMNLDEAAIKGIILAGARIS